jgi:hypothetical protein
MQTINTSKEKFMEKIENPREKYKPNPNPVAPTTSTPRVIDSRSQQAEDWRVSIAVPSLLVNNGLGPVMSPLSETNNKMIFPFTPTIQLSHSAEYNQIVPTHTNYVFNAYQNSKVNDITISGEFAVENEKDARYWVACLHFLRTMTKMFYGESNPLGNPPMVTRLNGYGKHVLNNIPVLITNFTIDLKPDVDYIPCAINREINYAPTQSTVTVTCTPNYARRSHSRFDLNKFANGGFVGGPEGFV